MKNNCVAIDFETYLISNEQPAPKPVCLSYYDGTHSGLLVGFNNMREYLSRILSDNCKIIAHNATFELLVTYEWFPELRDKVLAALDNNKIVCTQVYEQLLDNIRAKQIHRYGLDNLVKQYFNKDISEDKKNPNAWRLNYDKLDGISVHEWPQEAIDYAINDSIWAYRIYTEQYKYPVDIFPTISSSFYLNFMANYGLLVDSERVDTLSKELDDKLQPNYDKLKESGIIYQDKAGNYKKKIKTLREYIVKNVDTLEYTAKNNVSISSESLVKYSTQSNDELLNCYVDIMKYEKVKTAFISNLKQADPVIRTQYNATVSTGRTSSRKSTAFPSVNIQQMPRKVEGVKWDVRNCFVPRDSFLIGSIDYNGLELTSTAQQLYNIFGYSKMRDKLNSGNVPTDMHSMLASRIRTLQTGTLCKYEDFIAHKKDKEYKDVRQLAKPINLGFPGGIGYDTMRSLLFKEGIVTKLEILEQSTDTKYLKRLYRKFKHEYPYIRIKRLSATEYALVYDELVKMKLELFKLYPELERFLTKKHLDYTTGEIKKVKNEFGEWEDEPMYKYSFKGFERNYCTYTAFCNGILMQTPSAIGAKQAMNKIIRKYMNNSDVNPLAFIHDEIIFEVRGDCVQHLQDISEIMIDEMAKVLPDVRIAVEADLKEYWKKEDGFYIKTYFKDSNCNELRSD